MKSITTRCNTDKKNQSEEDGKKKINRQKKVIVQKFMNMIAQYLVIQILLPLKNSILTMR